MTRENIISAQSYLTFKLGDEAFAAHVEKVLEIVQVTKITKVPKSPSYMRGVINLRGSVLPVIDARQKFDMPHIEDTVSTCIMVLSIQIEGNTLIVGALVDAVQEVLEISPDQIQPAPSIGSKYKSEFIEGMVKVHEQFVMILSMDKVLFSDELILVKNSSTEQYIDIVS